jgi:tRNA threonylcarbamoyladenosine biosynthesis protein TsaB
MIYLLHIETATKACSVALSLDGNLIAIKETLTDEYEHGENLTLYIQSVLESGDIRIDQLSAVSVASGPGSYTGLRIGVSTVKGICYALGIPLISIDALQSLAAVALEKHSNSNLCALIDARRMEVYCAIYNGKLKILKSISADIIDESSYHEYEPFVFFGDGAEKAKNLWDSRKCIIDSSIHSSARGQVSLAYAKFLAKSFEDVAYFEPFYLKDFIASAK